MARLLGVSGGLAESGPRPSEVAVAAALFSPKGLADSAPDIDGLQRVRLMLGVETSPSRDGYRPCAARKSNSSAG